MKKHNALRRLLALLVFAALGFSLGLPQALSQDKDNDYKGILNITAFDKLDRKVATFDHDLHMDVAESCESCHHNVSEADLEEDDSDPYPKCVTCHTLNGKDGKSSVPLKRAYHQRCIGCHTEIGTPPTYCTGCHI